MPASGLRTTEDEAGGIGAGNCGVEAGSEEARSAKARRATEQPGGAEPSGDSNPARSDFALSRTDRVRSEGGSDKMEAELEEVLAEVRLGEPTNNQGEGALWGFCRPGETGRLLDAPASNSSFSGLGRTDGPNSPFELDKRG